MQALSQSDAGLGGFFPHKPGGCCISRAVTGGLVIWGHREAGEQVQEHPLFQKKS